jgi:hypothetical protein
MESEKVTSIVDLAATLATRAEDVDEVLIIYTTKSKGEGHSMDNGLTVSQANFLVDKFKHWLFQCMAKEKDGR